MTTLREEINQINFDIFNYGIYTITGNKPFTDISNLLKNEQHEINNFTDTIIERFENLIDEKIQSYKNISLNDTIIKTDCLEELKEELK